VTSANVWTYERGHPLQVGPAIGGTFGLVYIVVNLRVLPNAASLPLRILAVVVFVGVLAGLRRPAPDSSPHVEFGRDYRLVVAAEVVAGIGGSVLLTVDFGLSNAGLPWISFVVGLHFLGLAKVWKTPSLALVGAAIAVLGAVGLAIAIAHGTETAVALVAGVGPGVLLLGGSAWAARAAWAAARSVRAA
jgi:hypothetical protein